MYLEIYACWYYHCVSQLVLVVGFCVFRVVVVLVFSICVRGGSGSEVVCVCVCVSGRMLLNDSKKGPPHVQYRRPYGCAVLAMSDVLQTISELKEEKDFVLKVYT